MMLYDITDIGRAAARKLTQLDCVANNIANASTSGFKAQHLYFAVKGKTVQDDVPAKLGPAVTQVDYTQGTLRATGNPLDLALEGDGFFTLQTKQGTVYTRNGSFLINSRRELVTPAGDYVLGETGKIVLDGQSIEIGNDGTVYVDENPTAKLQISAFADPGALMRAADGRWTDEGRAGRKPADGCRIVSGQLEMSNVNAVKEMTQMMEIQRVFETYQKIIQTLSDMDKISTSRIGKLI